jgi:hypothetical protein
MPKTPQKIPAIKLTKAAIINSSSVSTALGK